MKRILFLQNLVYPLRSDFFVTLKNQNKCVIDVACLSDTASNRKWSIDSTKKLFPYKIFTNLKISLFKKNKHDIIINPFALFSFFRFKFDILISYGWANPTNMLFFLLCKILKRPYYLFVESTLNESSTQRSLFKNIITLIINNSEACIVPGEKQKEYVKSYSKNTRCIKIVNAIDSKPTQQPIKRKKVPIVILYVGRFEKIKNISTLIRACAHLKKRKIIFKLELVGYGPEKDNILRLLEELHLLSTTTISYSSHADISNKYYNSDIFVLPSKQEPWGFVINEAIAAGLPCIVSQTVGATSELVLHNKNGYIFNPDNSLQLSEYLEDLIDNKTKREEYGKYSKKLSNKYTSKYMVTEFLKHVH